jgi:hypothetical protein
VVQNEIGVKKWLQTVQMKAPVKNREIVKNRCLHRSVSNAEISTKNYFQCSFKLEKGPVFRISPVLRDLEENVHF